MPVSVRWDGVPEFDAVLAERLADVRQAGHDFVAQGLHVIEGTAKRRAREGGRHAKGTPTPAVHGRGPAVVTGTLGRSIAVSSVTSTGPFRYEGEVGPTAAYGRRIELEYDFPYMKPGTDDAIPRLVALMGELWRRAVTG